MKYQIKGVTEKYIEDSLKSNFTKDFRKVSFKPIGAGSWLYDVYDNKDKHYLLKINNDISENLIKALIYINNQASTETLDFVKTTNNKYVFKINNYKCILYEYIEGEIVGRKNLTSEEWKEIGKKIGLLNKITLPERLKSRIYVEKFTRCRKRAKKVVKLAQNLEQEETVQKEFAKFVRVHLKIINTYFKKTKELKKKIINLPLVFTHGDAHPWNIVKNNKLRFVDFDGVGMALPERDLMHYFDKRHWEFILSGYKEISPTFNVNENAVAYYQKEWVLQEIADYGEKVLFENISEKDKREALKDLAYYF